MRYGRPSHQPTVESEFLWVMRWAAMRLFGTPMAVAQILCCNPQAGPRNPSRVVWKRACVVDGRTASGSILLERNQCHDCGGGIQSHPSSSLR